MLAVSDPNHVPHGGGFVWKCDHCGVEFKKHTVPLVFDLARAHCSANGLEFTNAKFTENICHHTPGGICQEVDSAGTPTWVERVASAAEAAAQFVTSGFKVTPQEILQQRMDICRTCEWQQGYAGGGWATMLCGKCGCSGAKLALPKQRCPVGKWEAVA